jgi:hypothetical protein
MIATGDFARHEEAWLLLPGLARGIPQTRERRSLKSTGAQLASLVDQEMSARLRAIGSYAGNVKPVREFCDCPL